MPPFVSSSTSDISIFLIYFITALLLISIGIASCRGRHWIRPIIIIVATLSIFAGTMSTVGALVQLTSDGLLFNQLAPFSTNVLMFLLADSDAAISFIFIALAMIVLPIAMLLFYGKFTTREKLIALDPAPNWTDRLPTPALGWAIGCLLAGLSLLLTASNESAIFFNHTFTDQPAMMVSVVTGLPLLFGAFICYRHPLHGWRLTFPIVAMLAISSLVYLPHANSAELREIVGTRLAFDNGYRRAPLPFVNIFALRTSSTLFYCAALAFGLYVHRYFSNSISSRPTQNQSADAPPAS
jgi:hypothetical protein